MYCDQPNLVQSRMRFDDKIYFCQNYQIIHISCPRSVEDNVVDNCLAKPKGMECDSNASADIYCISYTLMSRYDTFCDSIFEVDFENTNEAKVLNCYLGVLPRKTAASIPTSTFRTPFQAPVETTTEKDLTMAAKVHLFFLELIGKEIVIDKINAPSSEKDNWIAKALTLPPSKYVRNSLQILKNGTIAPKYEDLTGFNMYESMERRTGTLPPGIMKVLITTESSLSHN